MYLSFVQVIDTHISDLLLTGYTVRQRRDFVIFSGSAIVAS
jgi:hypothetical protein